MHLDGSLLMGAVQLCHRLVLLVTVGIAAGWLIFSKEDPLPPVKAIFFRVILQLIPGTARSIPGLLHLGIWVLNAEYHVNMDYHSNYSRLLMEKCYVCTELVV